MPLLSFPRIFLILCIPASTMSIAAKVFGIWELGHMIVGFLVKVQDILTICLVNKTCYAFARPYLFRAISLPPISVNHPSKTRRGLGPFHKRFKSELSSYTQSLSIYGHVVAGTTLNSIRPEHHQWKFQEISHQELNTKINRLFNGIEQILACTPRLRAITSYDLPRSFDLIILLQRQCMNIEFIRIIPSEHDTRGFSIKVPSPNLMDDCAFPLWNGINLLPSPYIIPQINFPNLKSLSLSCLKLSQHHSRGIASILRGSPNLKHLELFTYPANTPAMTDCLFRRICQHYHESGAQPLRLQSIKLTAGVELRNDNGLNLGVSHYLAALTELDHLEDLNLEFPDFVFLPMTHRGSLFLRPNITSLLINGDFSRLRRLSMPHIDGYIWELLAKLDDEYASNLVVRVNGCGRLNEGKCLRQYKRYARKLGRFNGLVLENMPQPRHVMLPDLARTKSLKISVSFILGWNQLRHILDRLPRAPELCEIWITNGVDMESCNYSQKQQILRRLVGRSPNLSFVRICNELWRVLKGTPTKHPSPPVIKALPLDHPDSATPRAFDFSMSYPRGL